MSGNGFYCDTGEVPGITTAKTVLGIAAAANHRVFVKGFTMESRSVKLLGSEQSTVINSY